MGQFVSWCETLKGVLLAIKSQVKLFLTHSQGLKVKGHLLLRLSIKNLSIGRAYGAPLNLFWSFGPYDCCVIWWAVKC